MKTGTILSIDKKYAYIFTSDCHMVKVNWQPKMVVGEEINMESKIIRTTPAIKSRQLAYSLITASLVLLLAIGLIFGQGLLINPVYARLSIDVNPSLELAINKQLAVQSVKARNDDAAQLMIGQDFRGLDWQEAVKRWTEILRQNNQIQVQNMLISAVLPENAEQLRSQLVSMEGHGNQGILAGVEVRVIYSNDQAVVAEANQNGLSIGRQMLLNQARSQNQNWDEKNIADAPLGELIQKLLQDREQDQTRLTERTTQSIADQTGESTADGSGETNQETSRATDQARDSETDRQTDPQTSGSTQGSGTGSGTGSGSQQTNRETNRKTAGQTEQQTSGSTQGSGTGSGMGSGSQQTGQETNQQTNGSSNAYGSYTQQTIQQTSCETSCETCSETSCETSRETSRESSCETSHTNCESSSATSGEGSQSQQTTQIRQTTGH